MNRRIVIVTGMPLCRNPRVVKEANALAEAGYDVTVLRPIISIELYKIDLDIEAHALWKVNTSANLTSKRGVGLSLRIFRRLGAAAVQHARWPAAAALGYGVSQTLQMARTMRADLTIGHQEVGLFVIDQLAREGYRTGADLEDWYSEDLQIADRIGRPVDLIRRAENATIRRGGFVTTTSYALAAAFAEASGGHPPKTLYNVFPLADRDCMDGQRLDRPLGDGRPSLHWVSQTLGADRGLETLFAALRHVPTPVAVHLRGAQKLADVEQLRLTFPNDTGHELFVHNLVPPNKLLSRIAEHDIGLALEKRNPKNSDLTISNKMFHYLLGGLAVVATDTRGQAEVARSVPNAVSMCRADDSKSLAAVLSALVSDAARLKAARESALRAAQSTFCWERQVPILLDAVGAAIDAK